MFVGHAAIAFAVKPKLPNRSLGLLFAASFLLDLIWPLFLLLGIETVQIHPGDTAFTPLAFVHYPWTHGLLSAVVWAVLFAFVSMKGRLKPVREFLLLGGLVVSHWLLDLVVHRPDLPLSPGPSPLMGLGLWNSVPATLVIEGAFLAVGLTIYLRATTARDRIGSIGLWSLVIFMVAIWLSGPFSPPPPSTQAIGITGLFFGLIPLWAYWVDRHRVPKVH